MRARRRTLPDFEASSVALFVLLTLGGALHARAQTSAGPAPAPVTSRNTLPTAAAIPPNQWTLDQIGEAFRRTDANRDGAISRDEAKIWSGLTRKFDQVDANSDGIISQAEFLDALK